MASDNPKESMFVTFNRLQQVEEIPFDETLDSWLTIGWTTDEIQKFERKEDMINTIQEYASELSTQPDDVSMLEQFSELARIELILKNGLIRDDAMTQICNIADLRRFREVAITLYDGLITNGVDAQTAQALAIHTLGFLNKANDRPEEGSTYEMNMLY